MEGKNVTVISLHPLRGPIIIKIERMRIALGRGMASKIIVEVNN